MRVTIPTLSEFNHNGITSFDIEFNKLFVVRDGTAYRFAVKLPVRTTKDAVQSIIAVFFNDGMSCIDTNSFDQFSSYEFIRYATTDEQIVIPGDES